MAETELSARPPSTLGGQEGDDGTSVDAQRDRSFRITDLPRAGNIAKLLDKQRLTDIAGLVWDEYDIDKRSRDSKETEWDRAAEAFKLERTVKSFPFQNASNVKFPLLLTSAVQFASRAMPAVVHDGKVAKGKPVGEDPGGQKAALADRVGGYMNYQLLGKSPEWVEGMDQLLIQLPIYGTAIKKLYRDPVRGNVSEFVGIRDFVVNASYPSLDRAPRCTQRFDIYPNELEERKRTGRYLDIETINSGRTTDDNERQKDKLDDHTQDESAPHEMLEQHRLIDIDDDGYAEPYIVTLHVPSREVLSIVAAYDVGDIQQEQSGVRQVPGGVDQFGMPTFTEEPVFDGKVVKINYRPYYVKYGFIPDPEGGFYDIGFGQLLNDPAATINSILNQLIDAATLQNAGGGFRGKEFRQKAGELRVEPGKWTQATFSGDDIRKALVPHQHAGPSPVLFNLVQFLIEQSKEITSVQDVLTGDAPANQPATTTLAMIEQGMKVFTGIIARVLRALGTELNALFDLNARYMQQDQKEYFQFGDSQAYVMGQDFNRETMDVVPVADSTVVTDMQKMARANVLLQFVADPLFNPIELRKRYLEAAGIPSAGLLPDEMPPPPPDPATLKVQGDMQIAQAKLQTDAQASEQKMQTDATVQQLKLQMEEQKLAANLAMDRQRQRFDMELDAERQRFDMALAQQKLENDAQLQGQKLAQDKQNARSRGASN